MHAHEHSRQYAGAELSSLQFGDGPPQWQRSSSDHPLRRGGRAATREREALMDPPATKAADAADVMDVIEEERRRLRRAHSVLVCARFALDYSDYVEDEWELDVADVVGVACGLVREALENLDRVTMSRPSEHLDSVSRPRGSHKVRARARPAN
jgi:hypothetical protein